MIGQQKPTMCLAEEWQRDGRGLWAMRACQYYASHTKNHSFGSWRYNVKPPGEATTDPARFTPAAEGKAIGSATEGLSSSSVPPPAIEAVIAEIPDLPTRWRERAFALRGDVPEAEEKGLFVAATRLLAEAETLEECASDMAALGPPPAQETSDPLRADHPWEEHEVNDRIAALRPPAAPPREEMWCAACANGDHVQCLGGRCECVHLVPAPLEEMSVPTCHCKPWEGCPLCGMEAKRD